MNSNVACRILVSLTLFTVTSVPEQDQQSAFHLARSSADLILLALDDNLEFRIQTRVSSSKHTTILQSGTTPNEVFLVLFLPDLLDTGVVLGSSWVWVDSGWVVLVGVDELLTASDTEVSALPDGPLLGGEEVVM